MSIFTENTSMKPTIIGIDQGYGNIKTAHTVFPTGIIHHEELPTFQHDLLCLNGKYYTIGEGHKEFIANKAVDEDYYLLTLAAIAKELDYRGIQNGTIFLAVGLPLTWASGQKKALIAYMMKNRNVHFSFCGRNHSITIAGIEVYPQGYAAIAPFVSEFTGLHMLCDIGNGTMNVMYLENCRPMMNKCYTEKYGTHQCMLAAQELTMRRHQVIVQDSVIEEVLRTGTADIGEKYLNTIREAAVEYTEGILRRLREHEYNPDLMRLYVVGGGGCLLKNFAKLDAKRITINEDICATAKGYEWLAEQKLK